MKEYQPNIKALINAARREGFQIGLETAAQEAEVMFNRIDSENDLYYKTEYHSGAKAAYGYIARRIRGLWHLQGADQ